MEQTQTKWVTNYKNVTVRMTDGSTVKGKINIKEFQRLSLLFKTTPDTFIPVVSEEGSNKVSIINKNYILCAESED
ncbi:MAG TPA: hypothetical protein VLK23_03020 [Thermodesulfobacteriota bacterium]|nr:hypothetical protein [Thermodesulfobacteriota bacterium]